MTEQTKFLETEQAVTALLDELGKIKSASEQLDQAGKVAGQLAGSSQALGMLAEDLIKKSGKQLEAVEALSGKVSSNMEQFNRSRLDFLSQIQLLQSEQGELLEKIQSQAETLEQQKALIQEQNELIHQVEEKLTAGLASAGQRAARSGRMIYILLGISVLNAALGTALLVLKLIGR